jgi:hypothetical protein
MLVARAECANSRRVRRKVGYGSSGNDTTADPLCLMSLLVFCRVSKTVG